MWKDGPFTTSQVPFLKGMGRLTTVEQDKFLLIQSFPDREQDISMMIQCKNIPN